MKRLAAVLLLGSTLLASACGQPLLRSPRLLSEYKDGDPREQLVGRWAVEFARGDSTAVGTLTLTDTLGSPIKSTLLGRLEVDMTPVVGRSNECLQRGNKSHSVRLEHDSLRLSFSHYSECSVEVLTAWYGDSAAGQWTQAWFGPTCCLSGTFRMWRLR